MEFIDFQVILTVKSFWIRLVTSHVNVMLASSARSISNIFGEHSRITSAVFLVGSFGQWSANSAPGELLSPYPSPSESWYCDLLSGNASPWLDHPSWSSSGHPIRSNMALPASLGQLSPFVPAVLSP